MINNQKISGMVILSEAQWGRFPYMEAIRSFLPIVDELVIAFNIYGRNDGSLEKVKAIGDSKIRIVSTVFDLDKYGWVSYGIARTMGYQACKGDIVLMFDADGILHEKDIPILEKDVREFINSSSVDGYWKKNRFYKPTVYYDQHKHSGIYKKSWLGDSFDFFRDDGKGAPKFRVETPDRSKQFATTLFGYEHLWDTEEVLKTKVNRYSRMIDWVHNKPFKTPEEYFEIYMKALIGKVAEEGKVMQIKDQPIIIQEKLESINETNFGFNFFRYV